MKTVQELYSEIIASNELKKAFVEAMKANKLEDFLKEHDCEATEEEIEEFIQTKASEDTPIELSDEELKRVAGGTFVDSTVCCYNDDTCDCSSTCIRDCC